MLRILFVLFLSLLCLLPGCAADTGAALLPPGYRCKDCDFSFLQGSVPIPKHGVLFGIGGIEQTGATWYEADWDAGIAARYTTDVLTDENEDRKFRRRSEKVVRLSKAEEKKLKTIADRIWSYSYPSETEDKSEPVFKHRCYDSTWDLDLFDGEVVRHERGMCSSPSEAGEADEFALDKELKNLLEAK